MPGKTTSIVLDSSGCKRGVASFEKLDLQPGLRCSDGSSDAAWPGPHDEESVSGMQARIDQAARERVRTDDLFPYGARKLQ